MTSRVVPSGSRSQSTARLDAAASIWTHLAVTRARSRQMAPATPITRHRITVAGAASISNHMAIPSFLLSQLSFSLWTVNAAGQENVQAR
jgi:hypothetical protein